MILIQELYKFEVFVMMENHDAEVLVIVEAAVLFKYDLSMSMM